MNKLEKRALKTGVDENDNRLHYDCPKCGWDISLMHKKCPKCGNKRPKDAYARAIGVREDEQSANAPRMSAYMPDRSATVIPLPKKPHYVGTDIDDVIRATYATEELALMGIPKYYSVDEYGRVYEAPVSYRPLNGGGPVPIATPSKAIQTGSINVPVDTTK